MFKVISAISIGVWGAAAQAGDWPIFDAHIHYSHDAVEQVPAEQIAKNFRSAGVKKALVSSSDDNGTQVLLAAAPDIIVPALRPYRRRGETGTWMNDPSVIDYLERNLAENTYYAVGEYHAFGDDVQTPVFQRMIELAREYGLLMHHHGDAEAVEGVFDAWPEARVLWAHSGFDRPDDVAKMLRKHDNLWADLAFRSDMMRGGDVDPEWKAVFEEFPDRFMVGTDTFAPERWFYVASHAEYTRTWLALLGNDELAANIAHRNAERMLGLE